jgi:DNA-directed RNA polymerase specialized sigma24 family protein
MRAERQSRLRAALEGLTPDQAAAIRMVYFENCTLEEVRQRLGKPTTNAITKLLRRGMDALQTLLRDDLK